MLKKPASFVLGSLKSSTYPRGYASGFNSPAALLTAFLSILQLSAFSDQLRRLAMVQDGS